MPAATKVIQPVSQDLFVRSHKSQNENERTNGHVGDELNSKQHNGLAGHRKPLSTSYPSNSLNFLRGLNFEKDGKTSESTPSTLIALDILIVGAGLGGLATAVALARSGHHVTVLEQAAQLSEVNFPATHPYDVNRSLLDHLTTNFRLALASRSRQTPVNSFKDGG